MSWIEAIEDGVPTVKDKRSFNNYYPPCHICGTPVFSWSYIRGAIYTCPECRNELVKQEHNRKQEKDNIGKRSKFNEAIKRIQNTQTSVTMRNPFAVWKKVWTTPDGFKARKKS